LEYCQFEGPVILAVLGHEPGVAMGAKRRHPLTNCCCIDPMQSGRASEALSPTQIDVNDRPLENPTVLRHAKPPKVVSNFRGSVHIACGVFCWTSRRILCQQTSMIAPDNAASFQVGRIHPYGTGVFVWLDDR